jgi:hypothetical protein
MPIRMLCKISCELRTPAASVPWSRSRTGMVTPEPTAAALSDSVPTEERRQGRHDRRYVRNACCICPKLVDLVSQTAIFARGGSSGLLRTMPNCRKVQNALNVWNLFYPRKRAIHPLLVFGGAINGLYFAFKQEIVSLQTIERPGGGCRSRAGSALRRKPSRWTRTAEFPPGYSPQKPF